MNSSSQRLLRVDKTTGMQIASVPLSGSTTVTGFAGMATDPLSGTVYYADLGLYTLNLTTGKLTPVAGSKEPGPLGVSGLTFTVGACDAAAAPTISLASGM